MAQFFSVLLVSVLASVSLAQDRSSETTTTSTSRTSTTTQDAELSETERTLEELRKKAEARKKGQGTSNTSTTTPTRVNKNRGEVKVDEVKTVETEKTDNRTSSDSSQSEQNSKTSPSNSETTTTTTPTDPIPEITTLSPAHPFGVFINYSLLDLVVPSKYGVSGYFDYQGRQIEAEYLTGSISVPLIITDIGEIKDTRFSVRVRSFTKGGRFNWYWGVTYFAFDARLGADLLNSVTPGQAFPDYDIAEHRALGFDIGLGHRWELAENFVFGVDWFSWAQPLTTFKKDAPFLGASAPQELKDRVDKAIGLLTYVPRFSVAKISIGYVF